ncbi:ribonuclease HII [Candidatus Microgenomates bacterium]|nr:MAG: ribonuclease HII [Candidatus Microgenomates bacterium]
MKVTASFAIENRLWNRGKKLIVGIDEVGRGAFAGPVVVAGVIFPPFAKCLENIRDSKLCTAKAREKFDVEIKEQSLAWKIVEESVETINKFGIGKAVQRAFLNLANSFLPKPDHYLIDAFYIDHLPKFNQQPIVRGDQISASIAAASIIAKVYRDRLMATFDNTFPAYAFAQNKGYGTKLHCKAITQNGLSPLHRTSFDLRQYLVG